MDFSDAFRTWRNRTRKYDPRSIVNHALTILAEPSATPLLELKKAPWITLLMVKWICQDSFLDNKWAPSSTRLQVDILRQKLWEIPEQLGSRTRDTLPLRLFLRQLIRPQLGFQRTLTKSYVREAALLLQLGRKHPLCKTFEAKTRLKLSDFIDLSFVAFSAIEGAQTTITKAYFAPLIPVYSERTIEAFWAQVSRTFEELVLFCRSLPNAGNNVASEMFEFPVLARYPFYREGKILKCWHRAVFFRGMEGFVHSVLSEEGHEYMDRFSRVFEGHVLAECGRMPCEFFDESALQNLIEADTQVPDGLLAFSDCNVFVESKAGLFDESVMTVGHNEMFKHKTKSIAKAVGQAWDTAVSIREKGTAPESVIQSTEDFLLIVTNKELGASRGTALESIYPEGTLVYPNEQAETLLPLKRIYILAVEDFERLVAAAVKGFISVPDFLRSCVEADEDTATQVMLFEQHLNREKVPMDFSAAVEDAFSEASARVENALARE